MIRLSIMFSLIFFVLLIPGCSDKKEPSIVLDWHNNKATGIIVPIHLLKDFEPAALPQLLKVKLEKAGNVTMMGEVSLTGDFVTFSPLIPLSRGLTYGIYVKEKHIGSIKVPVAKPDAKPQLIAIYPTGDTVPENLLKLYLKFSVPMREGEALKHISLLNEDQDTLTGIFLDLQPELWNEEGNTLTLWLDPGRIKRDLIPNQQFGNPLVKGKKYTLVVSASWKDVQDLPLSESYRRKFYVNVRDSISPDPVDWMISLPPAASRHPLNIHLKEALDYFLLSESFTISDNNGIIAGEYLVSNQEKTISFIPSKPWKTGNYLIRIASHLEDLAGNNLERPFERDLQQAPLKINKSLFKRSFLLK